VAFLGDGASNQGTTMESYNLAKAWNLPAIFVVEDNGYAEATSSSFSVSGTQVGRAQGFGIPAAEVDGHDFFAVHEAAREMIERARDGGGPSLLHARVNRFFGHFEGDAMTYRAPDEVEILRRDKDPLKWFRKRVTEAGLLEADQLDTVDHEVAAEIETAVELAKGAAMPPPAKLLTDVYVAY
jgi:pyruvate dehydrogenase E1 component alpha subunit